MGFDRKGKMPRDGKKRFNKNDSERPRKENKSKIDVFKKEIEELKKGYETLDPAKIQKFNDFPLSERTKMGLKTANFVLPTEIQKDSIGLALKGHDILGAAKTGSGKTLAFIIPLLECLYRSGWTMLDGLGALIITPTRELAYQIFEVINKIGRKHNFSVALVIGGKDIDNERKLLDKCNILICTPGRLLQHMDENPYFDTMNLKMLILDEADRILDLGFQKTVNAILDYLPLERQTLLFSATQTKSVKDLARLSLKNPVYVSVHEHAKHSTPESLHQNYIVCDAHSKMNLMWSFLKSHKKQKILVFMASCKQVKYTYESFCRLRPGVSVMALYGTLHQLRRMQIYDEFCRKNHVVMFATDVAGRGLDFPNVNWVVQLDCPEDTNTYIHRVGRTARFEKNGQSLLVLLPSEKESMVQQLQKRKIPIEEQQVNPTKLHNIQKKLEVICARDVNMKDSAQRAYKAYLKNIFLMKDKTVFDVSKIDFELYAKSLGLPFAPRNRFIEKHLKVAPQSFRNQEFDLLHAVGSEDESEEELFVSKSIRELEDIEIPASDGEDENSNKKPLTKAAVAKRVLKKKLKPNVVMKFDDNGNPCREVCGRLVPIVAPELQEEMYREGYSIEKAKLLKEKEDQVDKLLFRERVKAKHRDARLKLRKQRKEEQGLPLQLIPHEEKDTEESSDEEIDPNKLIEESNTSKGAEDDTNGSESESDDSEKESDDAVGESEDDIKSKFRRNIKSESEEEAQSKSEDAQSELEDNQSHSGEDSQNKSNCTNSSKKSVKLEQTSKKRKVEIHDRSIKKKLKITQKLLSADQPLEDAEQLALHFLNNS